MRKLDLELVVGLFMVAGILCLAWLSIRLGSMEVLGGGRYDLKATFSNIGGLKTGTSVTIAGVEIGRVKRIALDLDEYKASVVLAINRGIPIQDDAMAIVKTRGLIGEKFVEITPGASETFLKPGETISRTQPAVDLESLISKYIFSPQSGGK
jgi:phospholipid/cholesterol/gamma-HCH transport system substrate-binding protein